MTENYHRNAIEWAIRYFLGREPTEEDFVTHGGHDGIESIRVAFSQTAEFKSFQESVSLKKYSMPLFLLPKKSQEAFYSPSLNDKNSQLCTAEQFEEGLYGDFCKKLNIERTFHRKQWEFVWILAALLKCDLIRRGNRGLGFGTGKEPLPSLLASYGLSIIATDAPTSIDLFQGWSSTNQHSSSLNDLYIESIVDRDIFLSNVSFQEVDMNNIPSNLNDFDFCWSACALEHLGSIKHGLDFIKNSLSTLRPGGFAFHTTEFNLSSNNETIESEHLSIFRKQDIDLLVDDLQNNGHKVWPVNYHPGGNFIDEVIDFPPYALPHLKLQIQRFTCTSLGLVIQRSHF